MLVFFGLRMADSCKCLLIIIWKIIFNTIFCAAGWVVRVCERSPSCAQFPRVQVWSLKRGSSDDLPSGDNGWGFQGDATICYLVGHKLPLANYRNMWGRGFLKQSFWMLFLVEKLSFIKDNWVVAKTIQIALGPLIMLRCLAFLLGV